MPVGAEGIDVLLAKSFSIGVLGFMYGVAVSGFTLLDDAVRGRQVSLGGLPRGLATALRDGAFTSRVLVYGMTAAGGMSLLQHGLDAPSRIHRLPFPSSTDQASTWVGCTVALYCAVVDAGVTTRSMRTLYAATGATVITGVLAYISPPEQLK